LSRHIGHEDAIMNRGDFEVPMIAFGGSIDCKYIGLYTSTVSDNGNEFYFPHYCYSTNINGSKYYLSIPKYGHICFIESICPDISSAKEFREDIKIKFIDGGGRSTSDYDENYKLTESGRFNAVVQQFNNAKENGPYFRRVSQHFWNGVSYGSGMVVDVRVPAVYIDEGTLLLFVDGDFRKYTLALNINGRNFSRACNKLKYFLFILTVPVDIATFPWSVLIDIEMIDH
jgi:hypothetical protein